MSRPLYYSAAALYRLRPTRQPLCSADLLWRIESYGLFHFRGCRGGRHIQRQVRTVPPRPLYTRGLVTTCAPPAPPLRRTLVDVQTTVDDVPLSTAPPGHSDGVFTSPPTILLLNPTSLAKPHALSMLHADMIAQDVQVAVISETWFKARHSAPLTNIPGYTTFRLDRSRRRGGGVAVYIDAGVRAEVCSALGHKDYEVLWVKTQIGTSPLFICALYHPPTPIYGTNDLLEYLEATLVNMFKITDSPTIILAGDMNKLPVDRLVALGLISVVNKPTHCGSCLDRNPNPNPNPNPRGGKKRPKHMVLVPQDRLEEGLICQGTEASEVKGGAGAYPPRNSPAEGSLEAEPICLRDIPAPARGGI